ncbi:MAG: hypothetical protein HQL32_16675 [Planctomycetes bacterium]|nr:hypothetical protein [Planctomycetota bacterium]
MQPNPLLCICVYYNPCGYEQRLINYRTFRSHLQAPLLTIELAYGSKPFVLQNETGRLIQLRTNSILWHKENLINIALKSVGEEYPYVALVDGDILFGNPAWYDDAIAALKSVEIVQLFEHRVLLQPGVQSLPTEYDGQVGWGPEERIPGIIKACKDLRLDDQVKGARVLIRGMGNPGYGWAMRKEVLAKGLYDRLIIGGGDNILAWLALRIELFPSLPNKLQAHYEAWKSTTSLFTSSCLSGDLFHLFHGTLERRIYMKRLAVLNHHDYDPAEDVAYDDSGLLMWTGNKPNFQRNMLDYFEYRQEDMGVASVPSHLREL